MNECYTTVDNFCHSKEYYDLYYFWGGLLIFFTIIIFVTMLIAIYKMGTEDAK